MSSITRLDIFAEQGGRKIFAGTLEYDNNIFIVQYSPTWLNHPQAVDIGDDIPLVSGPIKSKVLWLDIADRIPPRSSPTYTNYCRAWNLPTGEQDIMKLLATVGHRTVASCFVFYGPGELYSD